MDIFILITIICSLVFNIKSNPYIIRSVKSLKQLCKPSPRSSPGVKSNTIRLLSGMSKYEQSQQMTNLKDRLCRLPSRSVDDAN